MRVIHICRKPLGEGTIAKNVLHYGVGALNIDATRIRFLNRDDKSSAHPGGISTSKIHGDASKPDAGRGLPRITFDAGDNSAGRWPANLILQHLSGCKRTGVKRIRGSATSKSFHEGYKSSVVTGFQTGWSHPGNQHSDKDGMEFVDSWECLEHCPVAVLEKQGGDSVTGTRSSDSMPASVRNTSFGTSNHKSREYPGDRSSGASRFFKQVRQEDP